jgi:hypothetical protein
MSLGGGTGASESGSKITKFFRWCRKRWQMRVRRVARVDGDQVLRFDPSVPRDRNYRPPR